MRKTPYKTYKYIFSLVVFFCFVICYYTFIFTPVVKTHCLAKLNSLTEQALNLAVSNVINSTINYDNIMTVSYNQTGDVSFISANQYMINTITREVVKDANYQIKDLESGYFNIPVGSLTGISLLLGRGPKVHLNSSPVGIIGSSFESTFTSVGINNTLHQIYLKVKAKIEVTLPIKKHIINVEQQVLLCESVIVGKVPNMYLNSGKSDKVLNLIP